MIIPSVHRLRVWRRDGGAPFSSLPVQRTIVDGLEEVGGGDTVRLGEVGDRAGDAEDAVIGPGGQA